MKKKMMDKRKRRREDLKDKEKQVDDITTKTGQRVSKNNMLIQ